jgi:Tol biopolymer transport system component/DNA-binding winged helix-turn-helix (wHTH) protein
VSIEFPKAVTSRFGAFELNHGTGELFRRGRRIALQGQPARVLSLLVESAGEIISREDLRARIWPDATYGDFEASLNTAIKKIRQALSDSAQEPRFVQTVHRLGYRFIARVERVDPPEVEPESALASTEVPVAVVDTPAPRSRFSPLRWTGALVTLIVLAGVALYYSLPTDTIKPSHVDYRQLTHDGHGKLEPFSNGTDGVLVTDGPRIYFSAVSGTNVVISEVSSAGGETVPVIGDAAEPLVVKEISPDRSEILATQFYRVSPDLPLRILPLPGAIPRNLPSMVAHDGTWSPEGRTIAYASGQDIRLAPADGSASRTLLHCAGVPFWLRWSPNGTRLRFTIRDADGGTSIWEADANGQGSHRLLPPSRDSVAECCGNWSPDGRFYVFQSAHFGRTSIWVLRERSGLFAWRSSPVELTEGPLSMSSPVFSRNGRQIFAIGTQRRGELVRYNAKTGQFDIYLSGLSADHVEFSRDGQWIAYSTYPEGLIWRSRADGTERRQLSEPSITAWFPRWSPDGKRIAFTGTSAGKPVKIYVVPSSGGTAELLIAGATTEIDPNWSPDGKAIMFASVPGAEGRNGTSRIETIDLTTHQVSVLPGSDGLNAPRWSPDGRQVVATALSHNQWRRPGVVIFDFKSGAWSGLEDDPIDNKWWSADGKYFYFDKYVDNDPAIFRIRLSDRRMERVAGLQHVRRSPGVMGWWMGLTPDSSPIILRDTSIQEVYSIQWR